MVIQVTNVDSVAILKPKGYAPVTLNRYGVMAFHLLVQLMQAEARQAHALYGPKKLRPSAVADDFPSPTKKPPALLQGLGVTFSGDDRHVVGRPTALGAKTLQPKISAVMLLYHPTVYSASRLRKSAEAPLGLTPPAPSTPLMVPSSARR